MLKTVVLFTGVLLASVSPVFAQAASASISGTITDAQGGVLPGVTLTVQNAESGVVRTSVTEADGKYRVAGLNPGRYNLTTELPGFQMVAVKDITLQIGQDYTRDFQLALSTLQESVTVTGEAPIVEATKTEVATVVTSEQIATLPVQDRTALSLSLLLPGVGVDTTRAKRNATNVGASVTTSATTYLVDGLSNSVNKSGEQRHDIPEAAIREFAVHTTQLPAQYGQRVGGVVNIVTKSGTNDLHGEAFEFFRNQKMQRNDIFTQQQIDAGRADPRYKRNQYGFAVGGPIIRNKLHYFGTFERTREHAFFTVPAPLQFYPTLAGSYEGGSFTNIEFVRGDYQMNSKQNFFYRYINQHTEFFCSNCGGTASSFSNLDNLIPRDMHALGHTWVISNRVLNEFYFMRATASDRNYMNQDYTPANVLHSVVTMPVSLGAGQYIGTAQYRFPSVTWGGNQCLWPCRTGTMTTFTEAQETLSISTGNHNWKVGGSIQYFPTHEWAASNPGTWTFGRDQFFNPTDPNFNFNSLSGATQFTAAFPNVYRDIVSHTYAAYVSDEWKPVAGLTFNLGLRYDIQTGVWDEHHTQAEYPRPLPYVDFGSRGDKNNVGPRLGLAWDVRKNGRLVVRGGYGLVYTNVTNATQGSEITALKQNSIIINNPTYPDPYQGRDPASFASTAPPNINILSNDLVNAPVNTYTAGFSQQLLSDTAVNVDGVYQKATDYFTVENINTPKNGVRPLPEWGQILSTDPIGDWTYKALLVRLEKRLSHRYQYQISYTLAKQDGNYGSPDLVGINQGGTITDYYHPEYDLGPLPSDRRHALVISDAFQLPSDVVIGTIFNFRTSTPFSARAGTDLNADGQNTDYVPGTTKDMGNRDNEAMMAAVNAYRATLSLPALPASQIDSNTLYRFDIRGSKAINLGGGRRVELIGQVFNLFGRTNLGGVGSQYQSNARAATFGQILTAQARQQGEVALRFVW
ncbi:MAG TPA: TonB-dependent receptor [Vicinamibacterales bacterium]|jgi:outer membrane receptor protein involved in Fe transport|nr:TonB-dependent receptor [Vicinamibacterales bacterium]